jgi:ribosomal protein S18 acetylase RimI-like enzyme
MTDINFEVTKNASLESILELYTAVGWTDYTSNPARLLKAIQNSSYVIIAKDQKDLIGLARVISDDTSIMYLQDILVKPSHQRLGIGKKLLEMCLQHYTHVTQKILLTDNRPEQLEFYKSLGFFNTKELVNVQLNCFVNFTNIKLS